MKKYEYMTVDLSAEPSFNVRLKTPEQKQALCWLFSIPS